MLSPNSQDNFENSQDNLKNSQDNFEDRYLQKHRIVATNNIYVPQKLNHSAHNPKMYSKGTRV